MLELLTILVGLAIGAGAGSTYDTTTAADLDPPPAEVAPARAPEPQVPTGRFTTAVEVRPILEATLANWVAIREYDGQDLLYFTHLLSWRCGLWEIRYGLNGAPPTTPLALEPCHEDTAAPNAITTDTTDWPIYIAAPLGSIESVEVEIVYDDGSTGGAVYARPSVLMP